MRTRLGPGRGRVVCAAAGAWAASCGAIAQAPSSEAASLRAEEYAARALTRIAVMDVRWPVEPRAEDYRLANAVLGLAQTLTPDDADIARRRVDAAWAAGDTEEFLEQTRRLVRLDPADTVAQLRLISATIGALQTAEERLAAYAGFLGDRGRGLDPSIRSRLALDAALLHRERGDDRGFARLLSEAISLDSTNKDAAALAVTYFADRLENPAERIELTTYLLMADPVDPNVHLRIARELATHGAFEAADRFYANAAVLFGARPGGITEAMEIELRVAQWQTHGPRRVLDDLTRSLRLKREEAAQNLRLLERAQRSTRDVTKPEEVRLSLTFDRIRIMAADAAGDRSMVEDAMTDFERSVLEEIRTLLDPDRRPQGVTNEAAQAAVVQLAGELQLLRFWTDFHVPQARLDIEQLSATEELRRTLVSRLEGWIKLRDGDAPGAIESLSAAAQTQPLARIGVGQAREALGDLDGAAAEYLAIARESPLSIVGAWARSKLRAMGREPVPFTPHAAAAAAAAGAVPAWVDRITTSPSAFLDVQARVVRPSQTAADRTMLRITIRNMSPIPLGLGPDKTICSRFLVSPMTQIGATPQDIGSEPEVLDLDRRLRLDRAEALEVDVWPDPGFSGWITENYGAHTSRTRYRLLQGFVLTQGGIPDRGPLCVSTETGTLVRSGLWSAALNGVDLASRITTASEPALVELIAGARAWTFEASSRLEDPLVVGMILNIGKAVAQRYPALSPASRAMIAANMPHARLVPPLEELDKTVLAEQDPFVLACAIVTRVTTQDDPVLLAAIASPDQRLARLATLYQARLTRNVPTYARLTRQADE